MAMASGLAPIATPFYYARQALRGQRGLLMDFASPSSFAMQANRLVGSRALRQNVSRLASAHMRSAAWARVGQQYAAMLQRVRER